MHKYDAQQSYSVNMINLWFETKFRSAHIQQRMQNIWKQFLGF